VTPGDVNPTEADDTFRTTSDNLDGSIINGVGGSDKLEIYRMDSSASPTSVSNVGEVYITGRDAGNETLDADLMSDVTQFWSKDSTGGNVTVDNIQELATIGMTGDTDELTYTANFDSSLTGGTADAVSIALNAVGARAVGDNGATIDIDGFETFNVSNSGDTQPGSNAGTLGLNVTGDSVSTLSISGDGTLSLSSDAAAIDTVDASGFTGTDIEVDVRESTQDDLTATVSSAGDATVIVDNGRLAAALTDVSITLNTGDADDDDGALGVAGVADSTDIDNLDFSAGTISGVDVLAIANDQNTGIDLGAANAGLDLDGIAPSRIFFAEGDALDLSNQTLTISNENADGSVPSTLALQFNDEVDSTGGVGTVAVEDTTDLALDIATDLGATSAVDLTVTDVTNLSLNGGDADAVFGDIDVADGAAADTDTLSLSASGDNAITGTLDITGTNLNGITASNTGEGDRTFTLNGAADLKAEAGDNQAAGEGVTLTGAGTGTYTLAAASAVLNELAVDSSEYDGDSVVDINDNGASVDASSFSGVDTVLISDDYTGANGAKAITDIADGTSVSITNALTANGLTLNRATEGSLDVSVDAGVNTTALTTEMVDELTVTSTVGATTVADIASAMALPASTVALGTINLTADGGALTATDVSVDTETGADFSLTLNLTSDDAAAVTVTDVSNNGGGDNTTALTINSTGATENIVDDLTVAGADFETLTITGDGDLNVGDNGGADNDVSLADNATVDASAFTGDLTARLDREATGNETHSVELGSGSDEIILDADGGGAGEATFTFAFSGSDIGTDSIANFAENANDTVDDVLDFSAIFGAGTIDSYDATAGTDGALVDADGNVLVDFDDDGAGNTVATSDDFEGQLTLLGVDAGDLDNANFAETA
jgi:hypothetical protein